jgi:hypothetical protein
MTSALFKTWLIRLDNKMKINKKKIVLFMDNFSGHNIDLVLDNVKIAFYPPNCTSVLQPLDQGIIKNFKCFYRTKILRQIIGRLDTYTAEDPINLLDALHFIRSSWKDVKSTIIQNCFKKAGHNLEANIDMQINQLNSNELFITNCNLKDLKGINFDDFVSADDEISTEIV